MLLPFLPKAVVLSALGGLIGVVAASVASVADLPLMGVTDTFGPGINY